MTRISPFIISLLFAALGTAQELLLDYNEAVTGLQVKSAKQYGNDWYFIVDDGYYNGGMIKADATLGSSSFFRRLDVTAAEDEFTFIGNNVYLFQEETGNKSIIKYDPSNSSTLIKKYSNGSFSKIVEGNPFIIYEFHEFLISSWHSSFHRIDPSGHYDFDGELPSNHHLFGKLKTDLGTVVLFNGPFGFKAFHYVGGQIVKEVYLELEFPTNGLATKSWLVDDYLVAQHSGEIYFWKWDNVENDFALHFKDSTFIDHARHYFNPAANHFYLYETHNGAGMSVDWIDLNLKTKNRIENIDGNIINGAWRDKILSSSSGENYYTSDGISENIPWLENGILESVTADNYLLATTNVPQAGVEIARIDLAAGELINVFDLNPGSANSIETTTGVSNDYFLAANKIFLFANNGTDGNNLFEYNITNQFLQPHDPLSTCNKGSDYDFFIIDEALYALSVKRKGAEWETAFWGYNYEGDEVNEVYSADERLQVVGKAGEKVICVSSEGLYIFNGSSGLENILTAADLDVGELNIPQAEVIGDYIYFIQREGNKDYICRYHLAAQELIKIDPQVNSFNITALHKTGDRILFVCDNFELDEVREWPIDASAPLTLLELSNNTFALNRIYPHRVDYKIYYIIKDENNSSWELWRWSTAQLELQKLTTFPEGLYINSDEFFTGHDGSIYGKGSGSTPGIPLQSIWKYDVEKNETSIPNSGQSHLLKEIKAVVNFEEADYFVIQKTTGDNYVLAKLEEDFDLLHHFPDYYYELEPLGSFGADLLFGFKQDEAPGGLYRINVETLEFEKMNFSHLVPQDFWVTDNTIKYRDELHVVAFESCTDEEWWRFKIADYPTATEDGHLEQPNISISPNPTTGLISIEAPVTDTQELTLTIYNSTGQFISKQIIQNKDTIDLSNYAPGVYFLTFSGAGFYHTQSLVITK